MAAQTFVSMIQIHFNFKSFKIKKFHPFRRNHIYEKCFSRDGKTNWVSISEWKGGFFVGQIQI